MQSAEEIKKKERARQQKELARLLEPEFRPGCVLVLGDQGLTGALRARSIQAWGLGAGESGEWLSAGYELPAGWPETYDLVVIQGGEVPAPDKLPGSRLLFLAPEPEEASALPAWAETMAGAGLQRDFGWKSWGALSGAALFRPAGASQTDLAVSYEDALDSLRIKLDRAEQSCRDYQKLTEHQRSELSAAHEHENQLETALNNVTGSTCWKATWPVRYLLSKLRQLWQTFPLFVLLAQLRREGFAGLARRRQDRKYYQAHFPGQTFKANRLAPIDLTPR